ncbi:MAG: IS3 family transposase [Solirubrobacteraceae bacterium]
MATIAGPRPRRTRTRGPRPTPDESRRTRTPAPPTDGTDALHELVAQQRHQAQLTAMDNAVAETFFATLKKELVNRRSWPSRLELQSAVFEYIEAFYNRQRRHSTLGMLSPVAYEQLRLSPL